MPWRFNSSYGNDEDSYLLSLYTISQLKPSWLTLGAYGRRLRAEYQLWRNFQWRFCAPTELAVKGVVYYCVQSLNYIYIYIYIYIYVCIYIYIYNIYIYIYIYVCPFAQSEVVLSLLGLGRWMCVELCKGHSAAIITVHFRVSFVCFCLNYVIVTTLLIYCLAYSVFNCSNNLLVPSVASLVCIDLYRCDL